MWRLSLQRFSHKPNLKHEFLIIILYFWLPIEAKYSNLATFPSSFFAWLRAIETSVLFWGKI
jgi:hypothetical protein